MPDLLGLQGIGPKDDWDTGGRDILRLQSPNEDPDERLPEEDIRKQGRGRILWFLASLSVHILSMAILALLNLHRIKTAAPVRAAARSTSPAQRVYLPSREVIRQLQQQAATARTATPPPREGKDRISVGAPDPRHARDLILRRDQDISSVAAAPGSPAAAHATAAPKALASSDAGSPASLPLPAGRGDMAAGKPGAQRPVASPRPSILASLEGIEQRLQDGHGAEGLMTGAVGQQMGALFFDPQGADFTAWINHFKNEVYRNWIVPQAVMLGYHGEVDIEFTVDRDGTMHDVRVLSSSGTAALDHAATNALLGSRLHPLPADYGPPAVTMRVAFHYNDGRRSS
jgi:TonB family protein